MGGVIDSVGLASRLGLGLRVGVGVGVDVKSWG